MYCTRCGHRNPDDAAFCAKCGTPAVQDAPTQAFILEQQPVSLDDLRSGQALVIIRGGGVDGSTVLIENDTTAIGRSPECDVFLDDITVSRKHAEIRREGDAFTVVDSGSLNGTYLNRDRVDAGALHSGDEIQIGRFKLEFYTAPTESA
jgi:pSer/pThr/pTyr-binding forkhead associated (FHA) protein